MAAGLGDVVQAKAAAGPDQIPVAVLHQDCARYSETLVVLRLSRFEALATRHLSC